MQLLRDQSVPPFPHRRPVTSPTVFSASETLETPMNEELPPGIESAFDWDSSDEYDDPVPVQEGAEPQPQGSFNASERLQRSIKTYVVKDTGYKL